MVTSTFTSVPVSYTHLVIGRNVFWPAPNVDSALVLFKRYPGGHTPAADNADGSVVDRETVFRLIDAAFGQRRKTLHAALKKIVPSEAFEKAGIDPTRRLSLIHIYSSAG